MRGECHCPTGPRAARAKVSSCSSRPWILPRGPHKGSLTTRGVSNGDLTSQSFRMIPPCLDLVWVRLEATSMGRTPWRQCAMLAVLLSACGQADGAGTGDDLCARWEQRLEACGIVASANLCEE